VGSYDSSDADTPPAAEFAAGQTNSAAIPSPSPSGAPECHAAADAAFEKEIDKTSATSISIPGKVIDLPQGLSGDVTAAFVPGDVSVCASGLQPVLNTLGGFVHGLLSIGAQSAGPFVYDSSVTAWTRTPGAPRGQRFVTDFTKAKVEGAVGPSLSASFSSSGPDLGIDLASVTVKAGVQTVTLVLAGSSLLEAGLGPELEFSASIDKADAEQVVQDDEAEGIPSDQATTAAADELGGDAVIAIDQEAGEFYGISIAASQEQILFGAAQQQLDTALAADPALGDDFTPAAADPVPTEVTPGEAGAVTDELGADAIAADGLDDLIILFLL